MRKGNGRRQFLYLVLPVLLQWGIGLAVQMAAGLWWTAESDSTVKVAVNMQQYATELTTVASAITIPLMGFLFWRDRRGTWTGTERPGCFCILVLFVMGAASCITLNSLLMVSRLTVFSQGYQSVAAAVYESPFLVQIVGTGILTPVAEELTYRGMLFRRMRENVGAPAAILFSSLVFGILHGNLVQFLYAFVLGMLLAWVYEQTERLVVPVLLHMVINLVSLFATRWNFFSWMLESALRTVGVTTVSLLVAVAMIKIFFTFTRK